jgi:serine protease Do
VVVDAARGLIVTNNHVVPDAPRIVVTLPDGRQRTAREVRRDPRSDLALVTIDPKGLNLSQAEWGDSDSLDIGDWVLAIGQPFGLSGTVTAGIVSGKGRAVGAGAYEDLLQTDAAVNPGNSGGPMVDLRGRVVGINTAIKSVGGGYEGVGFAVPASRARRVAGDLAEFGSVRRAYLGVRTEPVDPEQSALRPGPPGAMIVAVSDGSPSAEAGLRPGDVVLKVGDRSVAGPGALQALAEFAAIGQPLSLTILRQEETREISVRPAPLTNGPAVSAGAATARPREGTHNDDASNPGRR